MEYGENREDLQKYEHSDFNLKLSTVFEQNNLNYVLVDNNLNIISFNEFTKEFFFNTLNLELLQNVSFINYIVSDGIQDFTDTFQNVKNGNIASKIEINIKKNTDENIKISASLLPFINKESEVASMMILFSEISKLSSYSQDSYQNIFQVLIDNIPGLDIVLLDKDLNFLMFTRSVINKNSFDADHWQSQKMEESFGEEIALKYQAHLETIALGNESRIQISIANNYFDVLGIPVQNPNCPQIAGISVSINISQQIIIKQILISLVQLSQMPISMLTELYHFVLENSLKITGSKLSFFHLINTDQKSVSVYYLTDEARKANKLTQIYEYPLPESGNYFDYLNINKPIINNGYTKITDMEVYSDLHIPIVRNICIPIKEKNKIAGIVEVSNKLWSYNEDDLEYLSLLSNQMWRIISRNLTNKLLLKHQERYGTIFEKSNSPKILLDPVTLDILDMNSAGCDFYGYSKNEIIGKNIYYLTTCSKEEIFEKIEKALHYKLSSYTTIHKLKNGEIRNVEVYISNIGIEDQIILYLLVTDITDKLIIERQLVQFKMVVDQSPNSIMITNINGVVEYVNPKFEEVSKYSKEEVIGKYPSILKSNHTSNEEYEILWDTILSGKQWRGELLNIKKTGEPFWESVSISPVKDSNDVITHFIAIKEDISDKKNKEIELLRINRNLQMLTDSYAALLYSEGEKELLFAFTDIAVSTLYYPFAWIATGSIIDNELTLKMRSYSSDSNYHFEKFDEELIIKDVNCPLFFSFNSQIPKVCHELEKCCLCTKYLGIENYNLTSAIVLPIGIKEHVLGVMVIYAFDNGVFEARELQILQDFSSYINLGLGIIYEKIEKQRVIENQILQREQLDITLKNIGDGIISIGYDGMVNLANTKIGTILEVDLEEIQNTQIYKLIKVVDEQNNINFFNPYDFINVKYQDEIFIKQLIIETLAKTRKIISLRITVIKDKHSDIIGFVLVIRDVTESIKLENQIALSQKMESVGQLAAGIAHEINTPMQFVGDNTYFLGTAFDSFIEYLSNLERRFDEFVKHYDDEYIRGVNREIKETREILDIQFLIDEIPVAIDRTNKGIDRVRQLVLAMKAFAHPSDKTKALANINQGIDVTVTISRNEWKYVAEVVLELDPELPLVNCLYDEINQVILNMIVNSAHAIADVVKDTSNLGKITIQTGTCQEGIFIKISDTGNGIPEDKISRIFDPFFTTKEIGKGTGQGLAIAHDIIVNKHNGQIFVDSTIGSGTTFTIKLPL